MKLFLILFTLINFNSYAEDTHSAIVQNFLKQRKEMIENLMKAFDDDAFFNDSFFKDDETNGFFNFNGFKGEGDNVKVEEKMESDGSISIFIKPLNPNQKLDINTTESSITIKSEMINSEESEGKTGKQKSYSSSSFSKTISIPDGYTAKAPEKVGDDLKISLIPSSTNSLRPDENGRVPVPRTKGEKTI